MISCWKKVAKILLSLSWIMKSRENAPSMKSLKTWMRIKTLLNRIKQNSENLIFHTQFGSRRIKKNQAEFLFNMMLLSLNSSDKLWDYILGSMKNKSSSLTDLETYLCSTLISSIHSTHQFILYSRIFSLFYISL